MTNKLKSLIGAIGLGATSEALGGSVAIWNIPSNPSTTAGSIVYLNHSTDGSVSGDSGDSVYSDPLLGPGQTAWLKATTQIIWEGNPYDLRVDNRPSTGLDANAPYTIHLAVGGQAVTSSGNHLQLQLVDANNEPQTEYSYVVNLYNGALFTDGSSTKSGTWKFSDGTTSLTDINFSSTYGDYGTATFTPIPEPGATSLLLAGLMTILAVKKRFERNSWNRRYSGRSLENKL